MMDAFHPSVWDHPVSQPAVFSQEALFDFDEFMQYDDASISPEEALPTIEKEQYNQSFTMSPPTPSTLIDECYSQEFDSSLQFGDYQFPCPPTAYSNMPLFPSGYAALDATLQYRSTPSAYTPAASRQSSHASFADSTFKDSPSPRIPNEPVTPIESPETRFLGERPLLPRVRPQDQVIKAPVTEHKRAQSMQVRSGTPAGIVRRTPKPKSTHSRSVSFDRLSAHMIGNDPVVQSEMPLQVQKTRPLSAFSSPVSRARESHQRRHSTQMIDAETLARYSRPTYRSSPVYMQTTASLDMQSSPAAVLNFSAPEMYAMSRAGSVYDQYEASEIRQPSPLRQASMAPAQPQQALSYAVQQESSGPKTKLATYLTTRNPSPNICSEIDSYQRIDKSSMWWWWDIRQVRPWSTFTLPSMLSHTSLSTSLTTTLPSSKLSTTPTATISSPKTLKDLKQTLGSFIIPRLNSALQAISSSTSSATNTKSLTMRFGDGIKEADFISSYNVGQQIHCVGILRTWTHWNSGLVTGREPERITYLRGLAELQGKMREAGTRYGFIVNETEITVVRNGTDATPRFGFVEVANFALSDFDTSSSSPETKSDPEKMTAMLALTYLHALASTPSLAGEATYASYVGAPVEHTRKNVLRDANGDETPKDSWIPEVKAVMDGRPAKNARGWVFPGDALSSKEKKKMKGVRYENYRGDSRR